MLHCEFFFCKKIQLVIAANYNYNQFTIICRFPIPRPISSLGMMSVHVCIFVHGASANCLSIYPVSNSASFSPFPLHSALTLTHAHAYTPHLTVELPDRVIIGLVTCAVHVCVYLHARAQAPCRCSVGPAPVKDKVRG